MARTNASRSNPSTMGSSTCTDWSRRSPRRGKAPSSVSKLRKKSPARAGLRLQDCGRLLLRAGRDRDLYTPIGLQARNQFLPALPGAALVGRELLGFAAPLRPDAFDRNPFAGEILLHRRGPPLRQALIVEGGADRVGEPDRANLTVGGSSELLDELVQLAARLGADRVLVEVEQRIRFHGNRHRQNGRGRGLGLGEAGRLVVVGKVVRL